MVRKSAVLLVLPAVLAVAFAGCGGGTDAARGTAADSAVKNTAAVRDAGKVAGASADSAAKNSTAAAKDAGKAADDAAGLKKLDEADRKLAEQQKYCPISGALLGSMDKPYKMTVKGRVVFLCCPGCEEDVTKDPEGTLKKIDALLAKK